MVLYSPSDVLKIGLTVMKVKSFWRKSHTRQEKDFHKHFGSSHVDLCQMWYHIMQAPGTKETDKSEKGFRMFLAAHFFLWTYPKNATVLASRFAICERYARGEPLWKWIQLIADLKSRKITWENHLDDPDAEIFAITVDGTDFKTWETKHPTLPIDRGMCSKKFNHAAVKYEVALSVYHPKCVWINGPFRGGMHDLSIYRQGLKEKIQEGKFGIADRGYRGKKGQEDKKLSTPNPMDSKELSNFKSRARLRHETFNGRLKNFACLSSTFRHGIEKHKIVFEAVAVIVQYQMDNGSPVYSV